MGVCAGFGNQLSTVGCGMVSDDIDHTFLRLADGLLSADGYSKNGSIGEKEENAIGELIGNETIKSIN